ncbi:MAG TPA: hypothetical protein DEP28_10830 [Bacteroidetes bacterium]|nr:hypothetical protein [Bacteroidota bacterium]HCN37320.1 hypothetical protein [Bacteroidota bacterium]
MSHLNLSNTEEHIEREAQHEEVHLEHAEHDTGFGTYILVWLGLVGLTAITVTLSGISLGSLTIITALLIATIKTLLVANYFMHVKFDTTIFKVFIGVCIIIFLTMIVLTFFDLTFRNPLI